MISKKHQEIFMSIDSLHQTKSFSRGIDYYANVYVNTKAFLNPKTGLTVLSKYARFSILIEELLNG